VIEIVNPPRIMSELEKDLRSRIKPAVVIATATPPEYAPTPQTGPLAPPASSISPELRALISRDTTTERPPQ
jgi:hypothetical protein